MLAPRLAPRALRPAARRLSLPARPPVAAVHRAVALACPTCRRLRVGAAAAVWRGALGRGLATGAGGEAAGGTSRHRGVSWNEGKGKWQAQLTVDGKEQHIAYFEDEEAAARAWDDALREHGLQEERGLNFPREGERSWADIEAERRATRERNLATVLGRRAEGRSDSPFRGVSWDEQTGKWHARLQVDGTQQHPGYFEDEKDAARAWDDAVRERGLVDKRGVNFPRDGEKAAAWSSEFRGVSWHKRNGKWEVRVQHQRKRRHVGCFDDEAAAARAYDAKAAELHGRKAKFNFAHEWEWAGGDSRGAWRRVEA